MTANDLRLAILALQKPCWYHSVHKSATCPECTALAEQQRDAQRVRESRRLHKLYEASR